MPIAALVNLVAKPGEVDALYERVTDVIADVRTESGNILAVVMRDPEESNTVCIFEIYRDQAAIDAHQNEEHTIVKGPAIRSLLEHPAQSQIFETIGWPAEIADPN